MMRAEDFDGLYAMIPTPAKPGADAWDATDTVDTAETSRLIEALIRDGVSGIVALGTTGECATLSAAEFVVMLDCVVETVAGRVPTFVGATALGTHETVTRLRQVTHRGATGTLLGLPMWQPLTTSMAVRFYRDISEAFPNLAVMGYANTRAFRYGFPNEFWAGVAAQAPTVISAKVAGFEGIPEMLAATEGKIRLLGNEIMLSEFYRVSPEAATACWATSAAMDPTPALAALRAARAGDLEALRGVEAELAWAHEPLLPILKDPQLFSSYNIQLEKLRMEEAGYCVPGPIRPPYNDMPADLEEGSRECGRRWKVICERLAAQSATSASS
jgi:dihydrodipicolinate synthase/N-acetylneuraminate lyase